MLIALGSALVLVVVGFSSPAMAEDTQDLAALAAALEDVKSTLGDGLRAGERIGKPISAKFVLEHGAIQLSLWVTREEGFAELIIYPTIRTFSSNFDFRNPDKLQSR